MRKPTQPLRVRIGITTSTRASGTEMDRFQEREFHNDKKTKSSYVSRRLGRPNRATRTPKFRERCRERPPFQKLGTR